MRSLRRTIFSVLILTLLVLFWFYRFDIVGFLKNLEYDREFQNLKLENEVLKFQLGQLTQGAVVAGEENLLMAALYSSYPFNDQARLIINLGFNGGLDVGMPVLAAKGVLLGRVTEVKKNLSEVQTIFDPIWRSSVGIGNAKIKALLVGGNIPRLTLIAKETMPAAGEDVLNFSPEYPYGLFLGRILEVDYNSAEPWASASLETFYNLNALDQVLVVTDHD